MTVGDVVSELYLFANPERKKTNEWFFKTGPGEYGEGDRFIGVCMPDLRRVAKQFVELPFPELQKLIESLIHEERLCALIIATYRFEKAQKKILKSQGGFPTLKGGLGGVCENSNLQEKKQLEQIYDWYLSNTRWVNNWDLVDLSAYKIVGNFLLQHPEKVGVLRKFAESQNMWERRISIVSTFAFIRLGEIDLTMELAEKLLDNSEDLMHKAVGWMLRECWKRDEGAVEAFLIRHYERLPRTTLRYAIERMEEAKRKRFLKGAF